MRTIKGFDEFAQQCEFFIDTASRLQERLRAVSRAVHDAAAVLRAEPTDPAEAARQLAEFTPQYLDLFTRWPSSTTSTSSAARSSWSRTTALYNISYLFRRDGTLGKQYKIHITPSERKWWGVTPGRKVRGLRHRLRHDRDSDLLRHRVSRTGADRGPEGRADHLRAVQHRHAARLPASPPLRHGPLRRESLSTWPSPAVRAICRSSRTPIFTTRSRPSSRRPTPSSPATPLPPNATPTSRP